jgi:hypothetical protein
MLKALNALNKLRGHLTKAEKSIWLALNQERVQIKIEDIQMLEKNNKQVERDLAVWYESDSKISAAKKRLEQAKTDEIALQDNNKSYRDCMKEHLRGRAQAKGWKMKTVESIHFDLFRGK